VEFCFHAPRCFCGARLYGELQTCSYLTRVFTSIKQQELLGEKSKTTTQCTRVGTLIVATIYLQLIQNRYSTCFEVLLSFTVVTSIVYNPLPAMWKS